MMQETDLFKWCEDIIKGGAGLHSYEKKEGGYGRGKKRDIEVAKWVLRCLGNPKSDGAKEVVRVLMWRQGLPTLQDI